MNSFKQIKILCNNHHLCTCFAYTVRRVTNYVLKKIDSIYDIKLVMSLVSLSRKLANQNLLIINHYT